MAGAAASAAAEEPGAGPRRAATRLAELRRLVARSGQHRAHRSDVRETSPRCTLRTVPASRLDHLPAGIPVAVLYGDDDIHGTDRVRVRFPHARQITLDRCGHLPWFTPEPFGNALADFYTYRRTERPHLRD